MRVWPLLLAASLALGGCTPRALTVSTPDAPSLGNLSLASSQLRIQLHDGRRTQTLPAVWDQVTITVVSTRLKSPVSETIATSSAVIDCSMRIPAGPFSATAYVRLGGILVALGSASSTANPGEQIPLSITLGTQVLTVGRAAGLVPGASEEGVPAMVANFQSPQGIALDASGSVYVADPFANLVRVFSVGGTIRTLAGNGGFGYGGDGGLGTGAALNAPSAVAVDASGSVYIADSANHCIRRVNPAGIITTIAGNGSPGDSGDGGPAASAQFIDPRGLVLDASGSLFVSDAAAHRVRVIHPDGTIMAFAGTGTSGIGGDGSVATSASLMQPWGLALDASGSVYIADCGAHCVRRVDPTGIIATFAGSNTQGYSGDGAAAVSALLNSPTAVAVDHAGMVYIADHDNQRLRRVSPDGIIQTVAGSSMQGYDGDGGAPSGAVLSNPKGVAVDASDRLYVADSGNARIRCVDVSTIATVAGANHYAGDGGDAHDAQLQSPTGIAGGPGGSLYVADSSNHCIRVLDPSGTISTLAGAPGAGYVDAQGTQARFGQLGLLAVDPSGTVYVADRGNSALRRIDPSGHVSTVNQAATLQWPFGVALDVGNGFAYVSDRQTHVIKRINLGDGSALTLAGSGAGGYVDGLGINASFCQPGGLVFDAASQSLYVADESNGKIRRVDAITGAVSTLATSGATLYGPRDIAREASGSFVITDAVAHDIYRLFDDGTLILLAGNGNFGYADGLGPDARFFNPSGIAALPDGRLLVGDSGNNLIRWLVP